MADLPGLIEGAHQGAGLGHQFLRHIERTRVIVHVVDMAGTEGRDPYDDWVKINEELKQYSPVLMERPQLIAANKMDLPEAKENLEIFRGKSGNAYPIHPISAVTGEGIQELLYAIADLLDQIPAEPLIEEIIEEDRKVYKLERDPENEFTIRRENEIYIIESEKIEKLFKRTNFDQYDSVQRFARILRKMGVEDELRKMGAKNGDSVKIADYEFEFTE